MVLDALVLALWVVVCGLFFCADEHCGFGVVGDCCDCLVCVAACCG